MRVEHASDYATLIGPPGLYGAGIDVDHPSTQAYYKEKFVEDIQNLGNMLSFLAIKQPAAAVGRWADRLGDLIDFTSFAITEEPKYLVPFAVGKEASALAKELKLSESTADRIGESVELTTNKAMDIYGSD